MGGKRPHQEDESSNQHNPEDGGRSRAPPAKHWSKRQKINASDETMSTIKKRARAIERLFLRDNANLPADKQIELERELAAHKQRIAESRAKRLRSDMIGKYHMVRFFERKKATRLAKQLKKRLAETEDPEEVAKIKADLHIAEVDIDYAIYHPFMEIYIGLYATPSKESQEEKPTAEQYLHAPRPPVWSAIEKAREEGQGALEKLQNRQPETISGTTPAKTPGPDSAKASQAKDKRERSATEPSSPGEAKKKAPFQKLQPWEKPKPAAKGENRAARRAKERLVAARKEETDGGGFFDE
ncbi:hypothetical protein B0T25DRAFT_449627 [Lasiosphaeria hispida]|uniref:rRNA-processing protein EFG1 n=1 Tax=Lasiosphaeria hispida TaxID=260671 RepID=A0AAJ0MG76_9PEZI|nr:hypothetical protein B0T25DRAFT_449627 [Lasiosphaeria hispida]